MCEQDIVIEPRRYKHEKKIPETGLLFVNPTEAAEMVRSASASGFENRFIFHSNLKIDPGGKLFICGPALGAPFAAITLEKLIALGAKKVVLCGWCGAVDRNIKIGDVILPDRGVIGEGTSRYYGRKLFSQPGAGLGTALQTILESEGILVKKGTVWSTDGVYREDRNYIMGLHDRYSVIAADMEFSALCSVAEFRGINFAAVLIVSDEIWGKSWRPGFKSQLFNRKRKDVWTIIKNAAGSF